MQSQVVGPVGEVYFTIMSDLPQGSRHREILQEKVQDALARSDLGGSSAKWIAQLVKHVWSSGLPAPFAHDDTLCIDKSIPCRHAAGKPREFRQDLHASPSSAPFKGAKLCTHER